MNTEEGSMGFGLSQIGEILGRDADVITEKWMKKERRELPNALFVHRDQLKNMIPKYLKALSRDLSSDRYELADRHRLAVHHGLQRWRSGWKLDEVIADYQLLRIVILEHLDDVLGRPLRLEEIRAIGSYVDEAIAAAVTAFVDQAESDLRSLNEKLEELVAERTRLAEVRAAKLRQLALDLINAEHNERQRVSRILHDDLQQLIATSRFRISRWNMSMSASEFNSERDSLVRILANAMEVSRNLALELTPPVDPRNIDHILEWLKETMHDSYGLELVIDGALQDASVGRETGLLLCQALRELLFNVVKHAKTRQAGVHVAVENHMGLVITVSDKGTGFDLSAKDEAKRSGFGLNYIRERLGMIGGKLDIWSMIGQGTRAMIRVPAQFKTRADGSDASAKAS